MQGECTRGLPANHQAGSSAFSEYVVSRHSLIRVVDLIDPTHAALLSCAILTGGGALALGANVKVGSTVAVASLGSVMMARAPGARRIAAIGIHDDKLAKAKDLGATASFNARGPDAAAQSNSAVRWKVGKVIRWRIWAGHFGVEDRLRDWDQNGMGDTAPLPFQPDYLVIQTGDTVKFLATDPGHLDGLALDSRCPAAPMRWCYGSGDAAG